MTEVLVKRRWRDVLGDLGFGAEVTCAENIKRFFVGDYDPGSWCFRLKENDEIILESRRTELTGWNDNLGGNLTRGAYEVFWQHRHFCFIKRTFTHAGILVWNNKDCNFPTFFQPYCPQIGLKISRWSFVRQSHVRCFLNRNDYESIILGL